MLSTKWYEYQENRLWPLLQDIITPMQSAFVSRRMITDNALIALECIHALRNGQMQTV
jgi:hypothetical protein